MKYLLLFLALVSFSCNKYVNIEQERNEIVALIDMVHQAHLEKDAKKFYQPNVDQWLDIRKGEIDHITKADQIPSTQGYLDNMEFIQLDTLGSPVIEISDDATLATYSSRVLVKGELADQPIIWIVAWQNVLKKIEGEWKIIGAVNTEADKSVAANVLLEQIRSNMGDVASVNSISALADCIGPDGNNFTTLIYSKKNDGRMEQLSGTRHSIFKHGAESWSKNLVSGSFYNGLDANLKVFAKSHELHWLSMHPEDRYTNANFEGIVEFKDKKAMKIMFVDDAQNPVNFYYDFENYLPLAFDIVIDDKGNTVTTYFENWSEQQGVKLFKNATFDQGGLEFKYNFTEIKINSLSKDDFELQRTEISL